MANFGDTGNQAVNSGGHLPYGNIGGKVTFTQSHCGKQGGVMWTASLTWPERTGSGSSYGFMIKEFGEMGAIDCGNGMGDVWNPRNRNWRNPSRVGGVIGNGNIVCSEQACKGGSMHSKWRILGPDTKNIVGRVVVIYDQQWDAGCKYTFIHFLKLCPFY